MVKAMKKKVTMQDIANQLGVTKVSVSKAINNQPGISDSLRKRILHTARELGYAKIKADEIQKEYRFAFLSAKRFFLEDEKFYTTIYYYLNRKCMDKNCSLNCFVVGNHEEENGILPPDLTLAKYDGIFIGGELKKEYLSILSGLKAEKVAIDFYMPGLPFDSVIVDNFSIGYEVTGNLIEKGHTRIGFVGNLHHTNSICDRYFGYLKAMKCRNLPIRKDWYIPGINTLDGVYTQNFDLPEDLPSAFVCHCDKAAFTLMQKLESCHIRIPEDVSITSFDNTSICELTTPKLSSVNIDKKQIALHSFNQMINRLNNPGLAPHRIYLSGTLVERDSIFPYPSKG
jgi:LacI family transcriptional regulator